MGKVAHIRRDPYDEAVDRTTQYGNPYRIGSDHPTYCGALEKMNRDDVLVHYADWLGAALVKDPLYLEPLRGKVLACWCRPVGGFKGKLLCHAQVIVGKLEGIDPATVE